MPPLKTYPLTAARVGDHQGPELFHMTELPGASPQIETVSPKTWEAYNLGASSTLVTLFHLTQALKNETRAA